MTYRNTFFLFSKNARENVAQNFLKAFNMIYAMTEYNFPNIESIIRRYINCFFKAYVNKENEKIAVEKDIRQTKNEEFLPDK